MADITNPQTDASQLTTGTLPAGRMPALTGDVTTSAGTVATTLAAGNAGNLNSGTLLAARMPALTGDTTSSSGTVATTTTSINGVNQTTAWTAYTPTITAQAGSITTSSSSGRSKTLGKTIFVALQATITVVGTGAGYCAATLPVAANTAFAQTLVGYDSGLSGVILVGVILAGDPTRVHIFIGSTGLTALATGAVLNVSGSYESA